MSLLLNLTHVRWTFLQCHNTTSSYHSHWSTSQIPCHLQDRHLTSINHDTFYQICGELGPLYILDSCSLCVVTIVLLHPLYLDSVSLTCVHACCIYSCHCSFSYTFIPVHSYLSLLPHNLTSPHYNFDLVSGTIWFSSMYLNSPVSFKSIIIDFPSKFVWS